MSTDNENAPRKVLFGDETEWQDFDSRNPEFALRVGNINAIFSRLDVSAASSREGLIFDGSSQRKRADAALLTAHKILLMVLDLQKNHFHLDMLEQPLQVCCEDIFTIWSKSALS